MFYYLEEDKDKETERQRWMGKEHGKMEVSGVRRDCLNVDRMVASTLAWLSSTPDHCKISYLLLRSIPKRGVCMCTCLQQPADYRLGK